MDVSILIVSYNTRELTLACLASVYRETSGVEFEVIVVDNHSDDGSAEAIRGAYPQVRLIASEENLGFAKANNLAGEAAAGRYLLLLNPDTVIQENAIGKVVEFAKKNPAVGVVGGRTYFEDGSLNPNSCHGVPTPWSLLCMGTGLSSVFRRSSVFDPESLGKWERDSVREVGAVTGCFLLIPRVLWEKLGGFDLTFFMYGEDTDLCMRAWEVGSTCVICPDAKLIHYGGKSERRRADKVVKLFRAKSQLIEKHWSPGWRWFGFAMLRVWAFSRMVACWCGGLVSPMFRGSYAQWREVWKRREDFRLSRS